MSDPLLAPRPAADFPRTGREGSFWLEATPPGHVLLVLARANVTDSEQRLRAIAEAAPHAVRPFGARQWAIVGESALSTDAVRQKGEILGEDFALSDQSHARVRFKLHGPQSRAALSRGCGLNFSHEAFPVGAAATTLFNHIGFHVARVSEDGFELLVARSFAKSFWDDVLTFAPPP